MADAPPPPWKLDCPECEWHILVNARGARGRDPGSGVEAAMMMQRHVSETHDKIWNPALDHSGSPHG